jgi:hypothetical protein
MRSITHDAGGDKHRVRHAIKYTFWVTLVAFEKPNSKYIKIDLESPHPRSAPSDPILLS